MFERTYLDRIPSKKGKVLYTVACGRDLTKLEIKERASLSMSTVLDSVIALEKEGLVTDDKIKAKGGGKPHSAVNVADRCVYGISYKSGKLFAVASDLRGEKVGECDSEAKEGGSPLRAVTEIAEQLSLQAPSPLAIAVAVNCREIEEILATLRKAYDAETLSVTNTAALAYRALWQGSLYPLSVIGFGNRIKCAFLDREKCLTSDLSELTLAPVFARERGCVGVLSAARVERILRDCSFHGQYGWEEGRLIESRDIASYSRLLLRGVVGIAETVRTLLCPREIRMFGDYLTQGFFDRVREALPDLCLVRECAEKQDFAFGAAIAALTERVFS